MIKSTTLNKLPLCFLYAKILLSTSRNYQKQCRAICCLHWRECSACGLIFKVSCGVAADCHPCLSLSLCSGSLAFHSLSSPSQIQGWTDRPVTRVERSFWISHLYWTEPGVTGASHHCQNHVENIILLLFFNLALHIDVLFTGLQFIATCKYKHKHPQSCIHKDPILYIRADRLI